MADDKQGLYMKYFVLKPDGTDEYALASRLALDEYASAIVHVNQKLANEIREWIVSIEHRLDQEALDANS